MPSSNKFTPTEARGTALAEEILAEIEAEEAYNERRRFGPTHHIDKKNAWHQGVWGEVHLDSLPPGTEIELVEGVRRSSDMDWTVGDHLAVIDSGVSCGTAMCFAGHAVTLAGDRMLFGISAEAADALKAKGLKANVKRLANKFRRTGGGGIARHGSDSVPSEYVLTREGKIERIEARARKLLKLTKAEAEMMFRGQNDLRDLRALVDRMKEDRRLDSGHKVGRKR